MKHWIRSVGLLVTVGLACLLSWIHGGDIMGARMWMMLFGVVVVVSFSFVLPNSANGWLWHFGAHAFVLVVLGVLAYWPVFFLAGFSLSEDELGDFADEVRAGEARIPTGRIGIYEIEEYGVKEDGSVFLWTDADPGGPEGFVFGWTGGGYNVWSELRLGEDCHYICED